MEAPGDKTRARLAPHASAILPGIPRPWVVWLGLVGFLLGVSLCAFNPVDNGEDDLKSTKDKEKYGYHYTGSASASDIESELAKLGMPEAERRKIIGSLGRAL